MPNYLKKKKILRKKNIKGTLFLETGESQRIMQIADNKNCKIIRTKRGQHLSITAEPHTPLDHVDISDESTSTIADP